MSQASTITYYSDTDKDAAVVAARRPLPIGWCRSVHITYNGIQVYCTRTSSNTWRVGALTGTADRVCQPTTCTSERQAYDHTRHLVEIYCQARTGNALTKSPFSWTEEKI